MLWVLLFVPLAGSALCAALHFAVLRARQAGAAHGGDPAHASHGPGEGLATLAGRLACAAMGAAFGLALLSWWELASQPALLSVESTTWHWIEAGGIDVQLSLVADRLSVVMLLVITGVGFLIHLYSLGYMAHDPGRAKFFAYLNLFVFAMLVLVLSSNLLGLFVGWEGVGLCSYLLIGFWYEKGWPADAAQKAFVTNRIGDACFLVGSFLLLRLFGTLDLSEIAAQNYHLLGARSGELALAALLLFGGACGKSAQFPLFTWLPDAMAGPTPVSALIHAATMVTAGVYLVLRLNPLFAAVPGVLFVIGVVGALTALIGASSALLQRDIKKVLAYSTVSQLGYMFLGLSAGAWSAALFHLVTHAFFKGLLFLGSGSVIHGMHDEQDMYKMGGLRRAMPQTFLTFVAGAAALSGLPLLSGFFSKDEILARNFALGGFHVLLWGVGLVTAALTAFYTWRMVALTFFGSARYDEHHVHPHESPRVMTVPLVVLAILSVVGGLLNLPHVLPGAGVLEHWLEPVTRPGNELLWRGEHGAPHLSAATEWLLLALGAGIALFCAHRGFRAYTGGPARDEALRTARPEAARFLEGAWQIDRAYTTRIVAPLVAGARHLAQRFDLGVIDAGVNGAGTLARKLGTSLRALADGQVKHYALWMGAGAAALSILMVVL
ncbi:MAG TPA: NADH-quinone oxidoreductase subunit L [Planctomycetota bacterium]